MKRKTLKKAFSAFLSLLMCMMTLLSISTPVFAATTVDAYMVDFPRDGDSNYSATAWGHSATSLMGGWRYLNSKYTTVHSIGTYNGQVSYCIEPGIGQNAGDTLSHKDETFWENYPSHLNPTISPDTIKVLLGRIMQYGYQGNVSTSWRSQNAADADALSHAIATQLLVWETVVGERDAGFNKVDPSGYGKSAVWSYIRDEHPLRSRIRSYYNSMAASVQSHAEIPSFCARSIGSARSYELKYDGTRYTVTLTDTNGVLSNFSFSSSEPGISFSRSGNRLTITSDTPIAGDIRVSASKTNGVRSGVVVWTDGNKGVGIQDVVTYGENVSDPVSAYLRLEMEALGVMHLVKTSEDGVVAGISFTISGNGITKAVTTGRDGTIDVSELMAGTYTVTEADIERYTPQTSQQVTIVGGQTSTVTFNNVLKRGALEVTKTSEDGFVEGVKFRLYGKSLSGLNVDEYAVTDSTGVAKFHNVLIGGPYTIEEVDTDVRYVIPDPQSVSIQWNRVAERSFANILKKFTVTVTKTDAETGTPQGDATLSGAKYGIYKGGKTDLPFGRFYLQEISTDSHYQLGDTKYPVSFDYAGQDKKLVKLIANEGAVIENKLIYGSVSGLKVDANDKPLSGAVMGLFAASETRFTKDTALLTAVSTEDGRFRFEKIPAGNWLVREIEQPKGFVLSEELFPVTVKEQGQVIEIKIANKLIRGSVTLTKYDADYPENKLSGAVFEVYRDVNGNKALDKDDVLLGTMEESSAGVYWMKNLEYGGVLVREKTAPEGFIPDEKAYYVEIDTDGKTYTVENEAGKGFINHALKGSLKIIKTTSDGKKEGFAFRITGANGYDMTFTTDSKGEIFIEKLRIGEYTVTELKNSASEGYKIADPVKITLVANETLTVKIHNDKTKVDVPKTGDDTDLMLWISLLGLAAAGVGCTAFFYLKKRRTGKHIAVKK